MHREVLPFVLFVEIVQAAASYDSLGVVQSTHYLVVITVVDALLMVTILAWLRRCIAL